MRLIRHGDVPISEAVKTFRFLAELIFIAGVLASSIGATAGAYIMTSEFPGSVYNDQWTDWFIGDVSLYRSWLGAEATDDAKSTNISPGELTVQFFRQGDNHLLL